MGAVAAVVPAESLLLLATAVAVVSWGLLWLSPLSDVSACLGCLLGGRLSRAGRGVRCSTVSRHPLLVSSIMNLSPSAVNMVFGS